MPGVQIALNYVQVGSPRHAHQLWFGVPLRCHVVEPPISREGSVTPDRAVLRPGVGLAAFQRWVSMLDTPEKNPICPNCRKPHTVQATSTTVVTIYLCLDCRFVF